MRGSLLCLGLSLTVGCGTPVSNGGTPLVPVTSDLRDRARTASARICTQVAGLSCASGGARVGEAECNDTFARILDRYPTCAEPFASFLECISRVTVTCDLLTSNTTTVCAAERAPYQACIQSVPRDAGRPDGG